MTYDCGVTVVKGAAEASKFPARNPDALRPNRNFIPLRRLPTRSKIRPNHAKPRGERAAGIPQGAALIRHSRGPLPFRPPWKTMTAVAGLRR